MQEESNKLARNTSTMFSKSSAAYETINNFMSKRVLIAAQEIKKYRATFNQDVLVKLAYELNVDSIYYFNSEGEILISNTGEFIGWKSFDGHPTERFRLSDLNVKVEDIRIDDKSNLHYKYAYARMLNGDFIQVGIYAEDVYQYLSEFEQQNIIDDLKQDDQILEISIIDKKYKILASSNKDVVGLSVNTNRMINSNEGKLFESKSNTVYEVFAPINVNNVNMGFLNIQYKLDATKEIITNMTRFGIILILSFYLIILFVVYNSYLKNKKLIQLVYYDTLTNLPNTDYLKYYVEENLKKDKTITGLILVNCINFKRINMSYGYKEGDFIIQRMAEKLKQLNPKHCKTFKFNADRFIVLVENVDDINSVKKYALEIGTMFSSNEFKPDLDVNMGIVEIEKVKQDVDDILRNGSIALNNVEINQSYAIFDAKMEQTLHREDVIEEELKEALKTRDHNRLYFQYQPIYLLEDHSIVSFE